MSVGENQRRMERISVYEGPETERAEGGYEHRRRRNIPLEKERSCSLSVRRAQASQRQRHRVNYDTGRQEVSTSNKGRNAAAGGEGRW